MFFFLIPFFFVDYSNSNICMKEMNHSPIWAFKSIENNIRIILLIYVGAKWQKKGGGSIKVCFPVCCVMSFLAIYHCWWLRLYANLKNKNDSSYLKVRRLCSLGGHAGGVHGHWRLFCLDQQGQGKRPGVPYWGMKSCDLSGLHVPDCQSNVVYNGAFKPSWGKIH